MNRDKNGKFVKGHKRPKQWIESHRQKLSGDNNPCKRPEVKEKLAKMFSGAKSHFWKGGVSNTNHRIRQTLEYRLWREAVFKRDNWTCRFCLKRGGRIQADHIKPFAFYPELRFAIDNGRTLCLDCHKQTDTYAKNLRTQSNSST